jgi:hypothetical protein
MINPSKIESTSRGGGGALVPPMSRVETVGLSTKTAEIREGPAEVAVAWRTEAMTGAILTSNCLTSVVIAGAGIAEHCTPSVKRGAGDGSEVAAMPEDGSSMTTTDAGAGDGSFSVVSSGGRSSIE